AVAIDTNTVGANYFNLRAGLGEFGDDSAEMIRIAIGNGEIASCDCAGNEKCSSFDALGIDAVVGTVEAGDSLHANGGGAGSLDLRAHGGEQGCQIGDLGL